MYCWYCCNVTRVRAWAEPEKSEGFTDVAKIVFIPSFASDADK